MARLSKNLINQRFGKLIAIKDVGKLPKARLWQCKCDCGKLKNISSSSLLSGGSTSCGKCKAKDLTNKTFGKWKVIRRLPNKNKKVIWECICECGTVREKPSSELTTGHSKSCGSCGTKNIINTRFGRLLVLERAKKNYYKCICECGNYHQVHLSNLKNDHVRSCGCLRKEISLRDKWVGYVDISGTYICHIRNRALKNNIEFNINAEYMWEVFENQKGICLLSGEKLIFPSNLLKDGCSKQTASIDRIDNNLGYIINNVRWVHKKINNLRYTNTDKELFRWIYLILNNNINNLPKRKIEIYNYSSKKGYCNISGKIWNTIMKRNKKFIPNQPISIEEAWNLYIHQNGRCFISGVEIDFSKKYSVQKDTTASLDRINPKLGYIKGNVGWSHKIINHMRWHLSLDEFLYWCQKIYDYSIKNKHNCNSWRI